MADVRELLLVVKVLDDQLTNAKSNILAFAKQSGVAESEVEKINSALIASTKSTETFAKRSDRLKNSISILTKQAEQLKDAAENATDSDQIIRFRNEYDKTTSVLADLRKELSSIEESSKTTGSLLSKVGASLSQAFSRSNLGDLVSGGITTALGNLVSGGILGILDGIVGAVGKIGEFFSFSSQRAEEFEVSLANLSAITGATGSELDELAVAAQNYTVSVQGANNETAEIAVSASAAAESFTILGSAAPKLLENNEALIQISKNAQILATAAPELSLQAAIEATAGTLNNFNLITDDTQATIDASVLAVNTLAAAARVGSSGIDLVSQAMDKAGGVAKNANLTIGDTAAAIETLGINSSLRGAEGGNALRNVILKLQVEAEKAGREFGTFSEEIQLLADSQLTATETTERFGLENVTAVNTLINNVDTLHEYTAALNDASLAQLEGGEAATQAAKNADTAAQQNANLAVAYGRLGIVVGNTVAPALELFRDLMTRAVGAVTTFISVGLPAFWDRIVAAGRRVNAIVAAIGKGILAGVEIVRRYAVALGTILVGIALLNKELIISNALIIKNGIVQAATTARTIAANLATRAVALATAAYNVVLGVLTGALSLTTIAQTALNAVMALSPIGVIVVLVGGLIAGFIALYDSSETLRAGISGTFSALKNIVGNVIDALTDQIFGLKDVIVGLFTLDFDQVAAGAEQFKDGVVGQFTALGKGTAEAFNKGFAEKIGEDLQSGIDDLDITAPDLPELASDLRARIAEALADGNITEQQAVAFRKELQNKLAATKPPVITPTLAIPEIPGEGTEGTEGTGGGDPDPANLEGSVETIQKLQAELDELKAKLLTLDTASPEFKQTQAAIESISKRIDFLNGKPISPKANLSQAEKELERVFAEAQKLELKAEVLIAGGADSVAGIEILREQAIEALQGDEAFQQVGAEYQAALLQGLNDQFDAKIKAIQDKQAKEARDNAKKVGESIIDGVEDGIEAREGALEDAIRNNAQALNDTLLAIFGEGVDPVSAAEQFRALTGLNIEDFQTEGEKMEAAQRAIFESIQNQRIALLNALIGDTQSEISKVQTQIQVLENTIRLTGESPENSARLAALRKSEEELTEVQREAEAERSEIQIAQAERRTEKRDEEKEAEIEAVEEGLEAAGAVANQTQELVNAVFAAKLANVKEGSEEEKRILRQQFFFNRALSAIQAGINTAEAVTRVLGTPAAPILIPLIVATGFAQVAAILSASPPSFFHGSDNVSDDVPASAPGKKGRDSVPAVLGTKPVRIHPGERILTAKTNRHFTKEDFEVIKRRGLDPGIIAAAARMPGRMLRLFLGGGDPTASEVFLDGSLASIDAALNIVDRETDLSLANPNISFEDLVKKTISEAFSGSLPSGTFDFTPAEAEYFRRRSELAQEKAQTISKLENAQSRKARIEKQNELNLRRRSVLREDERIRKAEERLSEIIAIEKELRIEQKTKRADMLSQTRREEIVREVERSIRTNTEEAKKEEATITELRKEVEGIRTKETEVLAEVRKIVESSTVILRETAKKEKSKPREDIVGLPPTLEAVRAVVSPLQATISSERREILRTATEANLDALRGVSLSEENIRTFREQRVEEVSVSNPVKGIDETKLAQQIAEELYSMQWKDSAVPKKQLDAQVYGNLGVQNRLDTMIAKLEEIKRKK